LHTGCAEAGSAPVAAGYIPGTTMIVANGAPHTIPSMGILELRRLRLRDFQLKKSILREFTKEDYRDLDTPHMALRSLHSSQIMILHTNGIS
jgi:hypothetical protein